MSGVFVFVVIKHKQKMRGIKCERKMFLEWLIKSYTRKENGVMLSIDRSVECNFRCPHTKQVKQMLSM